MHLLHADQKQILNAWLCLHVHVAPALHPLITLQGMLDPYRTCH